VLWTAAKLKLKEMRTKKTVRRSATRRGMQSNARRAKSAGKAKMQNRERGCTSLCGRSEREEEETGGWRVRTRRRTGVG
jgi:hypothetical protein